MILFKSSTAEAMSAAAPASFHLLQDCICSKLTWAMLTALYSMVAVPCTLETQHLPQINPSIPIPALRQKPTKIFFLLLLLGMGFCIYYRPG